MPFSYRASVRTVFDAGFVYPVSLLSLGTNDVLQMLARGVQRVATIALELGIPTIASIPHIIANAYKNIINISIETEYEFEGSKDVKAYLKDPSAFASSAPVQEHVASNNSNVVATTAPQEEEKKDEKDEESQSIGGIFGSEEEN